MTQLPAGTVTFLFTDMEGSTQLWENHPQEMRSALAQHNAITSHKGYVIKTTGDGAHAVFETVIDALHAAIQAQSHLHSALNLHPSSLCLNETYT